MPPFAQYLFQELQRHANPEKAPEMQRYMKTTQPFYGVQAPVRRQIFRMAKKQFPIQNFEEYEQVIQTLWNGECREDQYMALEVACGFPKFQTDETMGLYGQLLREASSWDTVDLISSNLIGKLLLKNRDHEPKIFEWRHSNNMWVRRASLLAHLKHKQETHLEIVSATIEALQHEKEFFIRKAIGWLLREISKTYPDWVQTFVDTHQQTLSGLSQREALKVLKNS